ncbi:MAG: SpoIIIAH-like family protein [Oscillospiraceae bacterium]
MKPKKAGSSFLKKQMTMVTLILALALAVYLNWRFANGDASPLGVTEIVSKDASSQVSNPSQTENTEGKNYGDALFVSAPTSGGAYFTEARLKRTQTRDEALDTLQKTLSKTDLTDAEKSKLTLKLTAVAQNIEKEGTVESRVRAKGFTDCVAFIKDDSVNIVVNSGESGLSVAQAAQIKEIVISECAVAADKITLVELN